MKKTHFYLRYLFSTIAILMLVGCSTTQSLLDNRDGISAISEAVYWQEERDHIGMLAAYSVVYKGWQLDNARGYNIGSVLLDNNSPDGRLVFWARNCNTITENETQHGEVRLMLGYLAKLHSERKQSQQVPNIKNLDGYTVYTTLEPCAQCAGMMTLQKINRTVYGQSDPGFGKAIERLEIDSSSLPNGYQPYPRPVISERSNILYCNQLEQAYSDYQKQYGQDAHITNFLKSEQTRKIFEAAYNEFMSYELREIKINGQFLDDAKQLVKIVPKEFVPLDPDI